MRRRFWIPTAALLALGLVFYFAVYGFRFAGVLLFLAAGVVLAFGIVDALRGRFPRFSRWATRIGLILVSQSYMHCASVMASPSPCAPERTAMASG